MDMDSFYAAIEERENPDLRGKAVVVCMFSGRSELSGSVSTCNYVAREYGIKSGMPCSMAKKLNPAAVFLPVRKAFYKTVSDEIMELLREYADRGNDTKSSNGSNGVNAIYSGPAPIFEQVSIDEAFLEVTERTGGDFEEALELGMQIKDEILEKERLTCSVGIGPNKLIAKMASSVQKPDGITPVRPGDVSAFLGPLKLTKLWGLGGVTAEKLQERGIETIGELAAHDVMELISAFGKKRGVWLKQAAAGIDESPVRDKEGSEQIGRIATLPEDTRNSELIYPLVDRLIEDLIAKLDARALTFRVVTLTAINSGFRMHTKSRTLSHAASDREVLRQTAREILEVFLEENPEELRRIGVRVGDLQEKKGQTSLFDY